MCTSFEIYLISIGPSRVLYFALSTYFQGVLTSQWLAISVTHSLTQTKNNVKVEELFEDDANNPEPENATYDNVWVYDL